MSGGAPVIQYARDVFSSTLFAVNREEKGEEVGGEGGGEGGSVRSNLHSCSLEAGEEGERARAPGGT